MYKYLKYKNKYLKKMQYNINGGVSENLSNKQIKIHCLLASGRLMEFETNNFTLENLINKIKNKLHDIGYEELDLLSETVLTIKSYKGREIDDILNDIQSEDKNKKKLLGDNYSNVVTYLKYMSDHIKISISYDFTSFDENLMHIINTVIEKDMLEIYPIGRFSQKNSINPTLVAICQVYNITLNLMVIVS
jgi:hypothetical protein